LLNLKPAFFNWVKWTKDDYEEEKAIKANLLRPYLRRVSSCGGIRGVPVHSVRHDDFMSHYRDNHISAYHLYDYSGGHGLSHG